eukprot:9959814-Prorocentrum_lima.AAC.1
MGDIVEHPSPAAKVLAPGHPLLSFPGHPLLPDVSESHDGRMRGRGQPRTPSPPPPPSSQLP